MGEATPLLLLFDGSTAELEAEGRPGLADADADDEEYALGAEEDDGSDVPS